jgi:hypothetical protein
MVTLPILGGMKTITYYAAAINPQGKIGQLRVTRVMAAPGVKVEGRQEWTGVVYRTQRDAVTDITRLNCK